MKKVIFVALFILIMSSVSAQVSSEYQWLIGTWVDQDNDVWTFNTNGTLVIAGENYLFSIIQDTLYVFIQRGTSREFDSRIYRINNQRVIIYAWNTYWVLNKRT